MIRNRAPRYRNLQNLHVIPTAPTVPVVPFVQPASNVLITVQPTTSIPETPVKPTTSVPQTLVKPTTSVPQTLVTSSQSTLNKNSQSKNVQHPFRLGMYNQNKYRNRRPRRRNRKRKDVDRFSSMQTLVPNKNDDWYSSNDLNQESCPPSTDNTQENADIENSNEKTDAIIEEAENYLEATGEEDFEEVEVASVDAADDGEASTGEGEASAGEGEASVGEDGKQEEILVGYRTSKILYLSYKKRSFFKPKVYNFSSQRTFVNCLNVQDNCSVDVDVVSEADYDEVEYEGEILDQSESQDYVDKMEVDEKNLDNTADASREKESDIKVDTKVKKDNAVIKPVKDDPKLKNKGIKEIKNLDHKSTEKEAKSDVKVMKNSSPVDTKSVKSKISTDGKAKTNDSKGELNTSSKVSKSEVKSGKNELTVSNNQNKSEKSDVNKVIESSVKDESIQRIYKRSVENKDDIHQGKCAIQSILDSWESHLIGLEYLIEIKNNNTNSSTMYNCILCSEDLKEKEFSSTDVIGHVNGRKHVAKFLEKHFPSCGIKLCDSSDCNFLVLQKICEEINAKLGYYYMSITNFDFYQNHKKEIIEIAQNASHSSEEHLKLSKNVFEKEVESNLLKEVKDVLSCVIKNVVSPEEISERESNGQVPKGLEITKAHKPIEDSVPATSKTFYAEKKKMSNTFKKCKGNASLTSFLKLKYAKAFKGGSKPAKGPSTKAVKEKSAEIVGAAKEKSSEPVGSVKETTTAVVTAEKENTESVGVRKEKNTAVAGAKKEKTLENNVAEEEMVTNEDPGLDSTQPIYQTGIMNDGDSDSSIQILEIKDVQKLTGHSKYCRKILVSVNQVMLINLIQANL